MTIVPPANKALLSAVVCPLIPREIPQALVNMELWQGDLCPAVGSPDENRPRLIFSFSGAYDAEIENTFLTAYAQAEHLHQCFAGIEILFLDLPPDKDLYIRDPIGKPPPFGNKAGPNWMFYETMNRLRHDSRFVFLMETDCRPLVGNWLRKLSRTCAAHEDAWIVGAHYSGASPLGWNVARHINGNALYHVGDTQFWYFLENVLWPWMHDHITTTDPNLAYDCAWETFLNREEMEYGGHYDWIRSRDVLHRFRLTSTIVNIGGHAEQSGQYIWTRKKLLNRFPNAAIVHGPISLRMDHSRGAISLGHLTLKGAAVDGSRVALSGAGAQLYRSLWLTDGVFAPGDEITVTLKLAGTPGKVTLIDLRDQSGRVLVRKKAFPAESGDRSIKISFAVAHVHNYLAIAIAPYPDSEIEGPVTIGDLAVTVDRAGNRIGRANNLETM